MLAASHRQQWDLHELSQDLSDVTLDKRITQQRVHPGDQIRNELETARLWSGDADNGLQYSAMPGSFPMFQHIEARVDQPFDTDE